jgi:hypothetical protein
MFREKQNIKDLDPEEALAEVDRLFLLVIQKQLDERTGVWDKLREKANLSPEEVKQALLEYFKTHHCFIVGYQPEKIVAMTGLPIEESCDTPLETSWLLADLKKRDRTAKAKFIAFEKDGERYFVIKLEKKRRDSVKSIVHELTHLTDSLLRLADHSKDVLAREKHSRLEKINQTMKRIFIGANVATIPIHGALFLTSTHQANEIGIALCAAQAVATIVKFGQDRLLSWHYNKIPTEKKANRYAKEITHLPLSQLRRGDN